MLLKQDGHRILSDGPASFTIDEAIHTGRAIQDDQDAWIFAALSLRWICPEQRQQQAPFKRFSL